MTTALALLAVALVAGAALWLRSRRGPSRSWHVVLVEGMPCAVEVSPEIPKPGAEAFVGRLRDLYLVLWPCLRRAYGLAEDEEARLEKVRVFAEPWGTFAERPDGTTGDVTAVGETIYAWPLWRVRLLYDPDGTGAWGWELRNVARRMAQAGRVGEWDPTPGDETARECLRNVR